MKKNNKELYRQFCASQKDLPIYSQAWYLDAVCTEGQWDVALVERGGRIVATIPYYIKRKAIFSYITQPHLCKMLGPYLIPEFRRLKQEQKLLPALIGQLPRVAHFKQNFHYQINNWMPFMWAGYEQTTNYTYVADISDLEVAYKNIDGAYRRAIRQAEQYLKIISDPSIETFYAIQKMSFDRKSIDFPFSLDFLKNFHAAVQQKGAGKMLFAVDEKERVHSVNYLIWDQHTCYGLMNGDDPQLRSSNSALLLTWESLKYAKEVLNKNRYDFVGSMLPEVERVRRKFGAEQIPYYNIEKYDSLLFKLLSSIKS